MKANERRYLMILRAPTIDELVDLINKKVKEDNIKIMNYDIRDERQHKTAVVFYSVFD